MEPTRAMEEEWLLGLVPDMLKDLLESRRQDLKDMRVHAYEPSDTIVVPSKVARVGRQRVHGIRLPDGLNALDNRARLLRPLLGVPQVKDGPDTQIPENYHALLPYPSHDGRSIREAGSHRRAAEVPHIVNAGHGDEGRLRRDASDRLRRELRPDVGVEEFLQVVGVCR